MKTTENSVVGKINVH